MAKSQALAWRELRVGVLVVTSVALLVAAIFFISGDSGLFTPKYKVIVYFRTANGLHSGAAVLLEGVTIGNVKSVNLSTDSDVNHSVRAELRLARKYHDMLRTDAVVTIGTVGLLGDQEVELTRGSADMPPVEDGGVLQGKEVGDIEQIKAGISTLVPNLTDLTTSMGELIRNLNQGKGTLGMILKDKTLHDKLMASLDKFNATADEANTLLKNAHSDKTSVGRLMSNDDMYNSIKSSINQLNATIGRLNNVVDKVDHGDGTIGKLLNDPALANKADKLLTSFGSVADRIDRGEGTLGKLSKDDTLATKMNTTLDRVDKLVSAVESGDGTLGKLVKDPAMYNSLTQTSSEIQKLLYDFRQNPKKYLTINFRLF